MPMSLLDISLAHVLEHQLRGELLMSRRILHTHADCHLLLCVALGREVPNCDGTIGRYAQGGRLMRTPFN